MGVSFEGSRSGGIWELIEVRLFLKPDFFFAERYFNEGILVARTSGYKKSRTSEFTWQHHHVGIIHKNTSFT